MRHRAGITIVSVLPALVLVAAGCSPGGSPVEGAAQAPPAEGVVADGITVSGAGEATGEPDVVRLTVGVEVERGSVEDALEDANAATQRVLAALGEAGIPEEDRQTRDFVIHPARDRDGEVRGYAVRNLVEATVRDVDAVGQVLADAAEAGGDDARVQGLRFELEDDGEQLRAARQAALDDAREKAGQYAEMAGVTLGELVGITDQTVRSPRPATPDAAREAPAAQPVPVEPGHERVVVQVVTRWTLE